MCSIYESSDGNPSQEDFNDASDLTCLHLEEFIAGTFVLGAPFILFESAECLSIETSANPNQICYEIAVSVSPDSPGVPTQDDVDSLVCIALLPPEVDTLLDDLALLGPSNPFSRSSGLTCDIAVGSDAPNSTPSDFLSVSQLELHHLIPRPEARSGSNVDNNSRSESHPAAQIADLQTSSSSSVSKAPTGSPINVPSTNPTPQKSKSPSGTYSNIISTNSGTHNCHSYTNTN